MVSGLPQCTKSLSSTWHVTDPLLSGSIARERAYCILFYIGVRRPERWDGASAGRMSNNTGGEVCTPKTAGWDRLGTSVHHISSLLAWDGLWEGEDGLWEVLLGRKRTSFHHSRINRLHLGAMGSWGSAGTQRSHIQDFRALQKVTEISCRQRLCTMGVQVPLSPAKDKKKKKAGVMQQEERLPLPSCWPCIWNWCGSSTYENKEKANHLPHLTSRCWV